MLATRARKSDLERARITELGWVRQIDALDYPARWQITDLTTVEIIRRAGWKPVLRSELRAISMFDRPAGDPRSIERFRMSLHAAFTMLRFTTWRSARRAARGTPAKGLHAVLIDQRNTVTLHHLWSGERDTVLVWGCAHLPGLEAGITARGYVRTGATEWHTAATLPTIRAIRCPLKGLPRTAGKPSRADAATTSATADAGDSVDSATPLNPTQR